MKRRIVDVIKTGAAAGLKFRKCPGFAGFLGFVP